MWAEGPPCQGVKRQRSFMVERSVSALASGSGLTELIVAAAARLLKSPHRRFDGVE